MRLIFFPLFSRRCDGTLAVVECLAGQHREDWWVTREFENSDSWCGSRTYETNIACMCYFLTKSQTALPQSTFCAQRGEKVKSAPWAMGTAPKVEDVISIWARFVFLIQGWYCHNLHGGYHGSPLTATARLSMFQPRHIEADLARVHFSWVCQDGATFEHPLSKCESSSGWNGYDGILSSPHFEDVWSKSWGFLVKISGSICFHVNWTIN